MKKTTIAALTLCLASATTVMAQESPRERASAALPAAVFAQVEALAAEGAASGIPEGPLFNKALEGVAKRVPANRLMPVLQQYAGRLGDARGALGLGASVSLVVAGADALQRGVPDAALRSLAADERHSPVAVLVLADLIETGVSSDRALQVLREAMAQRAREDRMLDIPEQVRRLVRDGASPRDAADQVRQRLQRTRGGDAAGPPVPPGSEPPTRDRARPRGGR
jgi:hypothetical protein